MTVNKLGMYIFVLKGLRRTFLEEPQKKKKKKLAKRNKYLERVRYLLQQKNVNVHICLLRLTFKFS